MDYNVQNFRNQQQLERLAQQIGQTRETSRRILGTIFGAVANPVSIAKYGFWTSTRWAGLRRLFTKRELPYMGIAKLTAQPNWVGTPLLWFGGLRRKAWRTVYTMTKQMSPGAQAFWKGVYNFYGPGLFGMPREFMDIWLMPEFKERVGDKFQVLKLGKTLTMRTAFQRYMTRVAVSKKIADKASRSILMEGLKAIFDPKRRIIMGESFLSAMTDKKLVGSTIAKVAKRMLKNAGATGTREIVKKAGWLLPVAGLRATLSVIGTAWLAHDILKWVVRGSAGLITKAFGVTATIYDRLLNASGYVYDRGAYMNSAAISERQRAVQEIHRSRYNARTTIGNEARYLHQ